MVTLENDLCLIDIIARFKGLHEETNKRIYATDFGTFPVSKISLKMSFRPSKRLRKFRTRKLPKIESGVKFKEMKLEGNSVGSS